MTGNQFTTDGAPGNAAETIPQAAL